MTDKITNLKPGDLVKIKTYQSLHVAIDNMLFTKKKGDECWQLTWEFVKINTYGSYCFKSQNMTLNIPPYLLGLIKPFKEKMNLKINDVVTFIKGSAIEKELKTTIDSKTVNIALVNDWVLKEINPLTSRFTSAVFALSVDVSNDYLENIVTPKSTQEMILKIQKEQLDEWKTKLNETVYTELLSYVEGLNEKGYNCPLKVFRGSDITTWIQNWKPKQILPIQFKYQVNVEVDGSVDLSTEEKRIEVAQKYVDKFNEIFQKNIYADPNAISIKGL